MDEAGKAVYDERGIYPTISRYYATGRLILKRENELILDASGRMHYEVESLYANYILDATDRKAALDTDPAEVSRQMRADMASKNVDDAKDLLDAADSPDYELAGTYNALINTPMGKQKGKIIFNVEGTMLTGTMDFMGRTYNVENGIATSQGYFFEINAKVLLRKMHATVRGTRSGDLINGTLTAPMGSIDFSGKRA